MPKTYRIESSPRIGLSVRLPYDGARHYDAWVSKTIAPGVELHTYDDGTPISIDIDIPGDIELATYNAIQ